MGEEKDSCRLVNKHIKGIYGSKDGEQNECGPADGDTDK
jgi:hypothetical protein